jgi:hypothetical protein
MRKSILFLTPVAVLGLVVACSSPGRRSSFDETVPEPVDGGEFEGSPGFTQNVTPCAGLECKIVDCKKKSKTTLRGKVYDPAGANPLYNVMVYIPGGIKPDELPEIPDSTTEPGGIKCETCSSVVVNPLRSALTDATGEFVLEDVPVDKDVPIVVQLGKWRRLVHVDITSKCDENGVDDGTLRLPRNSEEGNLPQIAVATGDVDALECLLRGIGVDDKEFVDGGDSSGHVHMYKGYGGGMGTDAKDFWNDAEQLKKYDMVLLSCEGAEHLENKGGDDNEKRRSMYDYLNGGGKVFATHYHYTWFKNSPEPEFQSLAKWGSSTNLQSEFDINTSFPKGEKFAEWLTEVGASSKPGKIKLESTTSSVKSINEPALAWIEQGTNSAKYFSVNTPISAAPENQCGRGVFSDVHMTDKAGPPSIEQCGLSAGGLNNQQRAVEFLFFDLSGCVTDDRKPPPVPK